MLNQFLGESTGATMDMPFNVSGVFNTSYMDDAEQKSNKSIDTFTF